MTTVAHRVAEVLGTDAVVAWADLPADRQVAIGAALADGATPPLASPATQAQLEALLTCAHGAGWRILPCGSGSKLDWGGLATGIDLVVSTAQLNQITAFAVGDLTVTVEAGTQLAAVQTALQAEGQFLALEPTYAQASTLGGLMATADAGPWRQRYGSLRDMVIGVEMVRHDGQRAKAGGQVVKNVAGYDMMKLLHGSYGTLGMVAQLTLRTFPLQEAANTVILSGEAPAIAPLITAIKASPLTPVACDLISTGLAAQLGLPPQPTLALRFQSIAAGVAEQVERLLALAPAGAALHQAVLTGQPEADFWPRLAHPIAQDALTAHQPEPAAALVKLGLLPTAALGLIQTLDQPSYGPALARVHLGSGVGLARLEGDGLSAAGIDQLRSHCTQAQGYLTLLRAPQSLKQAVDPWGYSGSALGLMGQVKHQFDPNRRLSPGRFVGGL